MFEDFILKSNDFTAIIEILRFSRRARSRVMQDISTEKYRHMYNKLDSIYFKFDENVSKTVRVIDKN